MIRLWRRVNYRVAELGADTFADTVQVLEPDGHIWYATWEGFISADAARRLEGARSVRLVVDRIEASNPSGHGRRRLGRDEYVQGCCVDRYAWAVVDQRVRIIPGPKRDR